MGLKLRILRRRALQPVWGRITDKYINEELLGTFNPCPSVIFFETRLAIGNPWREITSIVLRVSVKSIYVNAKSVTINGKVIRMQRMMSLSRANATGHRG